MQKTFKIEGMSCGHCANHVKQTFEKIEGVSRVEVALEKAEATVEFDESKTSVPNLANALSLTSYKIVS